MPRKLRELRRELQGAGYRMRPGKGSHEVWEPPLVPQFPVVLAGKDSDDSRHYNERDLRRSFQALEEAKRRQRP